VKTAADYRKNALECRALARQMAQAASREQLLVMAATWDQLAEQREKEARAETTAEAQAERGARGRADHSDG
jgi:hypothetical protein